jgi:hypothetical protein
MNEPGAVMGNGVEAAEEEHGDVYRMSCACGKYLWISSRAN